MLNLRVCLNCYKRVDLEDEVCPHCGKDPGKATVKCPYCKAEISESNIRKRCIGCGNLFCETCEQMERPGVKPDSEPLCLLCLMRCRIPPRPGEQSCSVCGLTLQPYLYKCPGCETPIEGRKPLEAEVIPEDDEEKECKECGTTVKASQKTCHICAAYLFPGVPDVEEGAEEDEGPGFCCPMCNAIVKGNSPKCFRCGTEFEVEEDYEESGGDESQGGEQMFECPECGGSVKESEKKCPYCRIDFA